MARLPKLVSHLHLPVQAGSDRVLAAMKRGYTVLEYKSIVRRLRQVRPDISISSDFIVGFPGETETDFDKTMALVAEIGFDASFSFVYSKRPGTPAADLPDDTPHDVKLARLQRLQRLVNDNVARISAAMVGTRAAHPGRGTVAQRQQRVDGADREQSHREFPWCPTTDRPDDRRAGDAGAAALVARRGDRARARERDGPRVAHCAGDRHRCRTERKHAGTDPRAKERIVWVRAAKGRRAREGDRRWSKAQTSATPGGWPCAHSSSHWVLSWCRPAPRCRPGTQPNRSRQPLRRQRQSADKPSATPAPDSSEAGGGRSQLRPRAARRPVLLVRLPRS